MRKIFLSLLRYFFRFIAIRNIGGYKSKPFVGFYSKFTKNTFLGVNCNFNGMSVRGKGLVTIGDNFHSGKHCLIINSYHKYDNGDAIPYDTKLTIDKDVVIGDNVWLGDRVIILGGVSIEEGVIVQAGSVVVHSLPKYSIAGGNPAKVFKHRNIESYSKLRDKGKFW